MPSPAIGLIGASIGGSALQASAASKAAKAQQKGTDQQVQLQRDALDSSTALNKPFVSGGVDAFKSLLFEAGLGAKPTVGAETPTVRATAGGYAVGDQVFSAREAADAYAKTQTTGGTEYGGYSQSPMAKYLLTQGVDSIEGSRAAAGGLYSGATLQALEDNRKNVIDADTGDYYNRLMQLAGFGQSSANNQAAAGQNFANNAGNAIQAGANAQAGGILGKAQAITGGIGDAAGIYGFFSNPMQAYGTSANNNNWLFGGNSWGARA